MTSQIPRSLSIKQKLVKYRKSIKIVGINKTEIRLLTKLKISSLYIHII